VSGSNHSREWAWGAGMSSGISSAVDRLEYWHVEGLKTLKIDFGIFTGITIFLFSIIFCIFYKKVSSVSSGLQDRLPVLICRIWCIFRLSSVSSVNPPGSSNVYIASKKRCTFNHKKYSPWLAMESILQRPMP